MSVQYPSHLYVRVDRGLRADLLAAAEARGIGVSETARALLRKALGRGEGQSNDAGEALGGGPLSGRAHYD